MRSVENNAPERWLSAYYGAAVRAFLSGRIRLWHFDEIKERMEQKASRLKRTEPPPNNTCG